VEWWELLPDRGWRGPFLDPRQRSQSAAVGEALTLSPQALAFRCSTSVSSLSPDTPRRVARRLSLESLVCVYLLDKPLCHLQVLGVVVQVASQHLKLRLRSQRRFLNGGVQHASLLPEPVRCLYNSGQTLLCLHLVPLASSRVVQLYPSRVLGPADVSARGAKSTIPKHAEIRCIVVTFAPAEFAPLKPTSGGSNARKRFVRQQGASCNDRRYTLTCSNRAATQAYELKTREKLL
jgi:hypothetical protein